MHDVQNRFESLRNATSAAVFEGPGATSVDLRQAVTSGCPPPDLTVLIDKIRSAAHTVTDRDIKELRSRYSEDQLFEIIVAASLGAALERLEAATRALEQA